MQNKDYMDISGTLPSEIGLMTRLESLILRESLYVGFQFLGAFALLLVTDTKAASFISSGFHHFGFGILLLILNHTR